MSRRKMVVGAALIVVLLSGFLVWSLDRRMARAELVTARREMATERYIAALSRLESLSNRPWVDDEVWVARGDCEQTLGEVKKALASWSKVADSSPVAGEADLRFGRVFLSQGRLSEAETKFRRALDHPGSQRDKARQQLSLVLKFQGRMSEVRNLIVERWNPDDSPLETIRELWDHDHGVYPIDGVRDFLRQAAQSAPDDDRVWLAKANLATRLGEFDEASKWLDKCLERRPEDPVVWESRLRWAIVADRSEAASKCLPKIPASRLDPAEISAIRAWFAASRKDVKAERLALGQQLEYDLVDSRPIERLAELAALENDRATVAKLNDRQARFKKSFETYKNRIFGDEPSPNPRDLAILAEALGRKFDAWAWWNAAKRDPSLKAEAEKALGGRIDSEFTWENVKRKSSASPTGATLADLVPTDARPIGTPDLSLNIPEFVDDAETVGLKFTFDNGRSDARQLPETMSGGVGLLDFDGDGLLDVYAVQGGKFPPEPNPGKNRDRLFRNLGNGQFQDVSEASGLSSFPGGYGHGVTVGDVDNDGDPDLFVTRWRSYALYRNKGNGTFEDATESLGLGGDRDWPTSAAFADLDNDGDLDLYVCHYLAWNVDDPNPCPQDNPNERFYCYPRLFRALPDHLFRNDGGKFVDVTEPSGIVDKDGRGLGVVAGDIDNDGLVDLYVANDTTANLYFHNLGGMKFEEIAAIAGISSNGSGAYQAGMGLAFGDQNGDGLMDLAVTNFYAEGTTLYSSLRKNLYFDHSAEVGLTVTSRNFLGFGLSFLDANNDGRLDLASANGHVNDGRPRLPYAMPARLWLGDSRGKLVDVSNKAGDPWKVARLGRGLATGDLDDDGRVDLVILSELEPLAYFHNKSASPGHFVSFRLEGRTSNRDAVGARVTLNVGGRSFFTQRFGGGSYQSASSPRLHFGLGSNPKVDSVEVAWPSGKVDRWTGLVADRNYRLVEGEPVATPLPSSPK